MFSVEKKTVWVGFVETMEVFFGRWEICTPNKKGEFGRNKMGNCSRNDFGVEIGFKLNDFQFFLWDPWEFATWMMNGLMLVGIN